MPMTVAMHVTIPKRLEGVMLEGAGIKELEEEEEEGEEEEELELEEEEEKRVKSGTLFSCFATIDKSNTNRSKSQMRKIANSK